MTENPGIILRLLVPEDWPRLKGEILSIEHALFPPALRQSEEEFEDVCTDPRAMFLAAFVGEELAAFGVVEKLHYYVEPEDPEYDAALADSTAYIETLGVKPAHQRKGIGSRILDALINEAKRRGYRHLAGHWRQGASEALAKRFGGTVRFVEENYNGTGETYSYIVIDL